jgi:hypothetical protein
MSVNLKRLSLANRRLAKLIRTKTNLQAQCIDLMMLRELLQEAQLSADRQRATRARRPAPVVIVAAA